MVIAGGGLFGLPAALDLARHGVRVRMLVLDDDDTVSTGSPAICSARRTLEIFGRLGLGARFLEMGVTLKQGRVFQDEHKANSFDLLPEEGHEYPAFVNLQLYNAEARPVEPSMVTGRPTIRAS